MTTTLCRTPRPRQHVGEIRRRERLREPPCFDCKAGAGAVRGEYQKQNIVLGVHPIGCHLQGRGQAFDRCTSASLRIVLHLDRAVPEAVRYDLRCAGRLAFKHALIAEKAEGHYAHLASILNGARRRNRRHDDQNKSDDRRPEPTDPRLGRHGEPRFVIATIAEQRKRNCENTVSPHSSGWHLSWRRSPNAMAPAAGHVLVKRTSISGHESRSRWRYNGRAGEASCEHRGF